MGSGTGFRTPRIAQRDYKPQSLHQVNLKSGISHEQNHQGFYSYHQSLPLVNGGFFQLDFSSAMVLWSLLVLFSLCIFSLQFAQVNLKFQLHVNRPRGCITFALVPQQAEALPRKSHLPGLLLYCLLNADQDSEPQSIWGTGPHSDTDTTQAQTRNRDTLSSSKFQSFLYVCVLLI